MFYDCSTDLDLWVVAWFSLGFTVLFIDSIFGLLDGLLLLFLAWRGCCGIWYAGVIGLAYLLFNLVFALLFLLLLFCWG